MKRYLNRKCIFAVMFIIILFGFSIVNALKELPTLKNTLKEFIKIKNVDNLKKSIKELDNNINNELMWKIQFVEGYGYIQALMAKSEFNDFRYVKDDNGFLNYARLYEKDDELIEEYAKRIRRLKKSVDNTTTKVMFISPPSKFTPQLSKFSEQLEVRNDSLLQDEFLLDLFRNGVDYLDLRKALLESNLSYENLFYRTDIHWTTQAAFVSFCALVEKMKELYSVNLDPYGLYSNLNNYNIITYKEDFLGSLGRDTGINYSGLDDFTLIWPKFATDFQYENRNRKGEINIVREGSFEDSLLNIDALNHKSDIYRVSSYTSYLDEIMPWDKIVNRKNSNGPKILIIRDSFSNPMIAFLAPLCSEIDMIWPLSPAWKVDVEEYLKNNKFDYVFVMLYPGNINGDGINFFKK